MDLTTATMAHITGFGSLVMAGEARAHHDTTGVVVTMTTLTSVQIPAIGHQGLGMMVGTLSYDPTFRVSPGGGTTWQGVVG